MSEINKNDIVSQEALDTINQLKAVLVDTEAQLKSVIRAGAKLGDLFLHGEKISELSGYIKTLRENIGQLEAAERSVAKAKEIATQAVNKNNAATKTNTKATSDATKAKKEAAAAETARAKAVRDSAKATREQALQLRANTQLLKAQTAATKAQQNADEIATGKKKSLTGATGALLLSVKNLVLAYVGLSAVISYYKKFEQATVALNAQNAAMKYTIANTFELAQSQSYLQSISQRFGLNLITISESYIKFRAAVNASNMTIDEGQKVFESMAKSSAVLGMTLEKTQDIFLALEQMVGKGGIMSEELRRQMGQHLPVAVTAMAEAAKRAGISVSGTVAELMKLMKAGKVIASEVLPYFGDAVEEQLGIKSVNAVDTLRVAQENLTLAWLNFVKMMKKDEVISSVYKTLANVVNNITLTFEDDIDKIKRGAGELASEINAKLVKGTTEKEKQLMLDKQVDALVSRRADLLQKINNIEAKGKIDTEAARKISPEMALQVSQQASRDSGSLKVKLGIINETLDLIGLNYSDLISIKEKKPLFGGDDDVAGANDALKIFKDKQAEMLADFIANEEAKKAWVYQNMIESGMDEVQAKQVSAGLQMDMDNSVFEFKVKLNKELLDYVKGDAVETADAKRLGAQNEKDIESKKTDFVIAERAREYQNFIDYQNKVAEEEKRAAELKKDQDIAGIETGVTGTILGLTNALPSGPIKDQRAYGALESKYNIDVLKAQEQGLMELLMVKNLTVDEEKRFMLDLDETRKAIAMAERADVQKTYELKKELQAEAMQYGIEAMNKTFDIFTGFQDAQMQRLEWDHEREVNLAGDNVAKKIAAENKYDQEKRKIQRRQAILQKAQSVANIVMSTAQAVMATLGQTGIFGLPLTTIILGIGALSLASALAAPIPNYEEGGTHLGGLARFSERGQELFIPKGSAIPMLTPKHETVANMPAGNFIPAKETQRLLAQGAMENLINFDMSPTNSILKTMANKEEVKYVDGYKITKTGRYATRS